LDLSPNMIIIYHGINDVHPRLVWPPEAYKGDNSGRSAPNVSLKKFPILLEHITVLRAIYVNLGGDTALIRYSRSVRNNSDSYYGLLFLDQQRKSQYPQGIFKGVTADQMFETNKPTYFKRNIENIVMIAKQRGIKVLLSTFAYNSKDFPRLPRVASDEYQKAFTEMNDVIREIAKEQDVELFDFSNVFPVNEKKYFVDGRHVNEIGSQLKAELFTNFIVKKAMVSKP